MKIFLSSLAILLTTASAIATPGALKADSICQKNGTFFGSHGEDNHWHYAVKKSNRWYAVGESLGHENPCN